VASIQTIDTVASDLLASLDQMVDDGAFRVRSAMSATPGDAAQAGALEALAPPALALMLAGLRSSEDVPGEPAELRRLARTAAKAGVSLTQLLHTLGIFRAVLLAAFEGRVQGEAGEPRLALEAERRLTRLQPALNAALAGGHVDTQREVWAGERARLASLLTVAGAVNRALEVEDAARSGLVETLRGLRLDAGGLWLSDGDDAGLVLACAVGVNWEENRLLRAVSARSSWLVSMAAIEPSPIQARFHSGNAVISGFRSAIASRLPRDGSAIGVLLLASRSPRTFTDAEVGFVAEATELLAAAIDRGQRHRLEARTDFLTGLANRWEFERAMEREIAAAARHGRPLSLMLIDLDRLKAINDELGHHSGDVAIRLVAELLGKEVRATDICARLGGDEFALAMPGAELSQAEEVARRLRASLQAASFSGVRSALEISIGLASWQPGTGYDGLFKIADARLYQDKRGRHARKRRMPAGSG
jgi:diguanylate cyclase (GGDEF)-like protein